MKPRDSYLYVPMLLGFTTSYICPISKESGSNQKQRPPGWVFGVIWPVLYLIIGYTWSKYSSTTEHNLFVLLNILLCSWIWSWSCRKDKKTALYIITGSIAATLALIKESKNGINLTPLVAWLFYAFNLNWNSIDNA
tara:strand:+ start:566 stop:976 length:411 start_codon:yes stop_codon:yes gene_type:complete